MVAQRSEDDNGADHALQGDVEANAGGGHSSSSETHGTGSSGNEAGNEDLNNLPEFSALDRYISTYRDPGALNDEVQEEKAPKWWQFWKSMPESNSLGPETGHQVPEAWLETDIRHGLSSSDVETRRKRYGYNELSAESESTLSQIFGYFKGPILYVMEIAALLAAGLNDWIDFGVIVGILALNAFVGFYQEKQAADIVASLKGDLAMKAIVVRDGKEQQILAREIVVGDIVVVEEGMTVPGDCLVICDYDSPQDFEKFKQMVAEAKLGDDAPADEKDDDGDDDASLHQGAPVLACDQSAITGESLAVDKYMGEVAYYTTGCKRGKGYCIVKASAMESFVGRTADLVQGTKGKGHFKQVMDSIGTALLVLVVFWILLSWIGGFFHHVRIDNPDSQNLLHYALILLIIGVPVGLPVVTTTTLAVGAAYLAKQKAVVQKLTAIESLAGVDVLCSDKTGTLTANKLSLRDPYVVEGQDINWMMAVAALASSHNVKSLDPIDKVTILSLKKYPKAREILQSGWKTDKFTPFDPVSKRITAECRRGSDRYICAKGAPKAIVKLVDPPKEIASKYNKHSADFAKRGFRSLGVAYKKNDEPWTLVGLLSMFDPPREDTAQTIIEAGHLGVPVKMLTGDALAIAKETCKMLALGTKVYNSQKLIQGGLSGSVQHDLVERADGFAEVFPEHKYQVVEMLQQRGHLTAMTGDGVNDAPSLKKADCGIAVEGATEAAQAAADIVFLAPGLGAIILSIKTSRQIFQRMKAYIQYRIALCLHLEIYVTTAIIILNEPIRVDLIVFLALFADLATVAVAYDNAHSDPRPVEWQLPKIWIISVILGVLLALGTWVIRGSMFLPNGGIVQNFGSIQEVLFLEIALTENWLIFVTRGGQTLPSWQLVGAIFGVDVVATCFCLFGWLWGGIMQTDPMDSWPEDNNGNTSIVTVVIIWLYSFGVVVFIAIVYYVLNQIPWLVNLGRRNRDVRNTNIENIIGQLNKLALDHEVDRDAGIDRYVLKERQTAEEDED